MYSQDELKQIINDLETESYGLTIASNDASLEGDDDTADLVDHAATSLEAAISHLKRFYKRRQKF